MSPAAVSEKPRPLLAAALTPAQERVLSSPARRLLVMAQPGCGGTEALVRKVACWARTKGPAPGAIAVLAPAQAACERLLPRLSEHLGKPCEPGAPVLARTTEKLSFELLGEVGEAGGGDLSLIGDGALFALAERHHEQLRLEPLRELWRLNRVHAMRDFLAAHRLLQRFDLFAVALPSTEPPQRPEELARWCGQARLEIDLGSLPLARAFMDSSARLHALLASKGLIDGATSEFELLKVLRADEGALGRARRRVTHIAVEHAEDLAPSQLALISLLLGEDGRLLAVGEERQAIERARGGRVELLLSLRRELESAPDGEVIELDESARATPMLRSLANEWAQTYPDALSGEAREMELAGAQEARRRSDWHPSHLSAVRCEDYEKEADWVAATIARLIDSKDGAWHDLPGGLKRRVEPGDVAVVLRSWSSVDSFLTALRARGIPAVLEGAETFSQPEVLAVLAALLRAIGSETIPGSFGELSMQGHATRTLGCEQEPVATVRAACRLMSTRGLPVGRDAARRLLRVAERLEDELRSPEKARLLTLGAACRELAGELRLTVGAPPASASAHAAASCHLATLERVAEMVQLPCGQRAGRDRGDFEAEVIALAAWAPRGARSLEEPQASSPAAVKLIPPERSRGRSFAAVFFADLRAHVLPSKVAKRPPRLPFDGEILKAIDPRELADDDSLRGERNVMHIAFTRSERYLCLTSAGRNRSSFWRWVEQAVPAVGGVVGGASEVELEL